MAIKTIRFIKHAKHEKKLANKVIKVTKENLVKAVKTKASTQKINKMRMDLKRANNVKNAAFKSLKKIV